MKLFSQLLTVLSVTSTVLSGTLSDISFKIVNFNTISKNQDCQNDINDYKQCFALLNYSNYANNFKEVCEYVYDEKCQEFYEDPILFMPNCQDSVEIVQALSPAVININLSRVGVGCKTDENGELCPIANAFFNNESIAQSYASLFEATCKSPKCTTALIDALMGELAYAEDAESLSISSGHLDNSTSSLMNRLLEDLNSNKCGATNVMKRSDDSSDFLPISVNNTLLIIALSLILLSFF